MTLAKWHIDPGDLAVCWSIDPGDSHLRSSSHGARSQYGRRPATVLEQPTVGTAGLHVAREFTVAHGVRTRNAVPARGRPLLRRQGWWPASLPGPLAPKPNGRGCLGPPATGAGATRAPRRPGSPRSRSATRPPTPAPARASAPLPCAPPAPSRRSLIQAKRSNSLLGTSERRNLRLVPRSCSNRTEEASRPRRDHPAGRWAGVLVRRVVEGGPSSWLTLALKSCTHGC